MPRKGLTVSQTAVYNIRWRLRKDMVNLARTHRGCAVARGCQCLVDKALTVLQDAERKLFEYELESASDPYISRRLVNDDNTITITAPEPLKG